MEFHAIFSKPHIFMSFYRTFLHKNEIRLDNKNTK